MTDNAKPGAIAPRYSPLMLLHVSGAQDLPAGEQDERDEHDKRDKRDKPDEHPPGAGSADGPDADPSTEPDAGPQAAPDAGSGTPPDAGSGAGLDAVLARLAELADAVSTAAGREHERAAHREAVIDRLHEENTRLRRGELEAVFEPVRAALYRLHDMTRREAARWRSDPPDPVHAADLLAAVADEVAEALARTGVERFTVAAGEPYDPARHRPVASEPVTDPGLDGSVLRVHADGFARGDRVLRKAEVSVGRPAANGTGATGPIVRTPSPS